MKFLYTLVFTLALTSSVVVYHFTTTDTNKKYQDISNLGKELKYISISSQFKALEYKEFIHE
jgi:DNA mismatch repair protein MutH